MRVQTGRGDSGKLAQVPIIVNVRDINDNAPYFTKDHYYGTATVNTIRGFVVTKVIILIY